MQLLIQAWDNCFWYQTLYTCTSLYSQPPDFTSTGHVVYLTFTSDWLITGAGFYIKTDVADTPGRSWSWDAEQPMSPWWSLMTWRQIATHQQPPLTVIVMYRQSSIIRRSLVGNNIVDHSDVVGAAPVSTAPTTSAFSTEHMASI